MTSEYDGQIDDDNVICPYCKYDFQPEPGDFDEDGHEIECDECGKKFHARVCIQYDYRTEPDCGLNNEPHKWRPVKLRDGTEHDFCSVCDKCRPYRED